MQEIKKRRIVIASVLKPVDDPRMFEKIGESLAGTYDVHIIGYPTRSPFRPQNMSLYSLDYFSRLSISRALAPFRIFGRLIALRPALTIITTHELLFISVLYKLISGTKVIYDVQENYYRNVRYTKTFPNLIRHGLAAFVRLKERLLAPFITHFFLAEQRYVEELTFIGKSKTVLENKLVRIDPRNTNPLPEKNLKLIFTGTLAESTGTFMAVDLAEKLHTVDSTINLLIIGYCADAEVLNTLRQRIKNRSFVRLVGGDQPVPHAQILQAIKHADVGIISYPPNPSTEGSIPTKLYEYLGLQLPILLIDHAPWTALCNRFNAAVVFKPEEVIATDLLKKLHEKDFYPTPVSGIFWEEEAPKLREVIRSVLPGA